MTGRFGRLVRGAGIAVALASVSMVLLTAPARAQLPPGMTIPGMPPGPTAPAVPAIMLTNELVVSFIAGYPTIVPGMEAIRGRYNIPQANDPATAMAAMVAATAAAAELNALVAPFGFTDFGHYSQVFSAIFFAWAFADPEMTAADRAQMAQGMAMLQAMGLPMAIPPQENIDIVAAHYVALDAIIDD